MLPLRGSVLSFPTAWKHPRCSSVLFPPSVTVSPHAPASALPTSPYPDCGASGLALPAAWPLSSCVLVPWALPELALLSLSPPPRTLYRRRTHTEVDWPLDGVAGVPRTHCLEHLFSSAEVVLFFQIPRYMVLFYTHPVFLPSHPCQKP